MSGRELGFGKLSQIKPDDVPENGPADAEIDNLVVRSSTSMQTRGNPMQITISFVASCLGFVRIKELLLLILRGLSRTFSIILRCFNILFSGKVLAVRAICLDEDNRIFLVRHTYTQGWHLPGGGVPNGMSALKALEKELREEGNLWICSPPCLRQIFFNQKASVREHVVLYTVIVRQMGNQGRTLEIVEGRFFPLHALPADTVFATLCRIQEMRGGSFGTVW